MPEITDHYFRDERAFQVAVTDAVIQRLALRGVSAYPLPAFGLDVAFFVTGQPLRLLEFKAYFGQRAGGVGFGNGKGQGPQVDLLLLPEELLRQSVDAIRWCFANCLVDVGEPRFAMRTNMAARDAAMGGVQRGKQNNFRVKDVFGFPVTFDRLVATLASFVAGERSSAASPP